MNIHPILVHFPIAILTLYALMELLRFKRLNNSRGFWYAKAYSAVVGSLAAFAAFGSGDEAGGRAMIDPAMRIAFHVHENWAAATVTIFAIIAFYYLIQLIGEIPAVRSWLTPGSAQAKVWVACSTLSRVIGKPFFLVTLALAGLAAITVTGALGGSLVYGPDVDPIVSLIYKLIVN